MSQQTPTAGQVAAATAQSMADCDGGVGAVVQLSSHAESVGQSVISAAQKRWHGVPADPVSAVASDVVS